jgi:hypothetical protein
MFVGGLWLVSVQSAVAHPQLMTSVRHRTAIHVSRKNVDVIIELTVGEIPAFTERLQMDNNQDGRIEASEVEGYINEQSGALQQAVSLSIAGQPVEMLFLYEPEIDLGIENTSSASHLIFRLFYFTRLPSGLKAGDEIVLEDRLWSHAPSLGSYHVAGQDGLALVAEKTASTLWSTPGDEKPLVMHVRCLAAPDATSDGEQGDQSESTDAIASIVESKLPESASVSVEHDDLGDLEIERPLQEPSTARLPVGWLFSLGAVVLIASAAAVLTRRPYRSREET